MSGPDKLFRGLTIIVMGFIYFILTVLGRCEISLEGIHAFPIARHGFHAYLGHEVA